MTKFIYKCIEDITKKDYDLTTDSFQKAIDWWAILKSVGGRPYIFVDKLNNKSETIVYRTLNSRETIKEWADYLMLNGYNRVEKRLIKELQEQEHDGMEVVEPKDTTERYEDVRFRDEMPDLMGKVFGGSESLKETLSKQLEEHLKDIDFHGAFEEMSEEEQDQIINPKHYKIVPPGHYENGLEYMDICDFALGHLNGVKAHLVGQILKYTLRVGKKDAFLQDSRKIEWYAKRLVKTIEDEEQTS